MSELVERLREIGRDGSWRAWRTRNTHPVCAEAADRIAELEARVRVLEAGRDALGPWMSAALDDPKVCEAMKADIITWFGAS